MSPLLEASLRYAAPGLVPTAGKADIGGRFYLVQWTIAWLHEIKATLDMILAKAGAGIRFNAHLEGGGETMFRHACKLRL
jgi:hypothetical protein